MGPGQTCPQSSSCARLVSSGTRDLTHSKSNLMLFSLTVILPVRQEHRCLVTDELYSFAVTSCHRAEMIPMAFHLVTFILLSHQVTGHSCGKICFLSAWKGDYKPMCRWAGSARKQGQKRAHPKLLGGLCICGMCLWEECQVTGRLNEGKELGTNLSVPGKSWMSWSLNRGSYRHLPLPPPQSLLPARLTPQYLPRWLLILMGSSFLWAVACVIPSARNPLPPALSVPPSQSCKAQCKHLFLSEFFAALLQINWNTFIIPLS